VKRVTNGVTRIFAYDGWKPVVEWDGASTFVAWNMYGPGPDAILMRYRGSDASYLHYHSDQFGNVKFLLNSANLGIEKYTYDAFGATKITDWAGNVLTDSAYGNRFMFTGREYLSTTGIYDYRNRMYSPLIGRFLQTDPMRFDAGDNNLFRYVGHNPANRTDPQGLLEDDGAPGMNDGPHEDNPFLDDFWREVYKNVFLNFFRGLQNLGHDIPLSPYIPVNSPPDRNPNIPDATPTGPPAPAWGTPNTPVGTWGGTYPAGSLLQWLTEDTKSDE
jgi:RHS repeat-associated protein